MKILEQIREATELWEAAVPSAAGVPPSSVFFVWVTHYPAAEVERAILRTGKRMLGNLRSNIPLVSDGAARFCSSILGNRAREERNQQHLTH